MVAADPSGQFVIANDAGLDLTLVWRFDAQAGRLLPADVPVVAAPSGSAPRHFVFHPNGRVFYNLYEHDAKVAVYDYDAAKGGLKLKQVVRAAAEIRRQQSVLGNRHHRRTAGSCMCRIDCTMPSRFLRVADDGQLRSRLPKPGCMPTHPRSLTIDPSGAFLYSCNQSGDSITSFHINRAIRRPDNSPADSNRWAVPP